MIVVDESESDKPTGWRMWDLTELNDNSDYFGNMYSEIKHSLDPIHILKFELFEFFCAIHSSWWATGWMARLSWLAEYTVHLFLIIKLFEC